MSWARRVDATHHTVTAALRRCGWDVYDNSRAGLGAPDLLAWHHGRQALRLIEVKTAKGRLTTAQLRLVNRGWPITILRSAEDAVKL